MNIYVIVYHSFLRRITNAYYDVINTIKSLGEWQHPTDELWFVKSEDSLQSILDKVGVSCNVNDVLFVSKLGEHGNDYVGYMQNSIWPWLKKINK